MKTKITHNSTYCLLESVSIKYNKNIIKNKLKETFFKMARFKQTLKRRIVDKRQCFETSSMSGRSSADSVVVVNDSAQEEVDTSPNEQNSEPGSSKTPSLKTLFPSAKSSDEPNLGSQSSTSTLNSEKHTANWHYQQHLNFITNDYESRLKKAANENLKLRYQLRKLKMLNKLAHIIVNLKIE